LGNPQLWSDDGSTKPGTMLDGCCLVESAIPTASLGPLVSLSAGGPSSFWDRLPRRLHRFRRGTPPGAN